MAFAASRALLLTAATAMASKVVPPSVAQPYRLLQKTKLSPDSFLLRFELLHRQYLGDDPMIPTCLKIDYDGEDKDGNPKKLGKSYSPVSHPKMVGSFDLIVKAYPYRPGGGVGAYLCDLEPDSEIIGTLKKPRKMHGSPEVIGRWKRIGMIAGGTGIAPLLQIARMVLEDDGDDVTVSILSINRYEQDILARDEMEDLATKYPDRLRLAYALTGDDDDYENNNKNIRDGNDAVCSSDSMLSGRGSVEMARQVLPPPTNDGSTMILVCGKDGFVSSWAGPVARAPPLPDGSKGPKIQGPLLGILADAGYDASEVFKY